MNFQLGHLGPKGQSFPNRLFCHYTQVYGPLKNLRELIKKTTWKSTKFPSPLKVVVLVIPYSELQQTQFASCKTDRLGDETKR